MEDSSKVNYFEVNGIKIKYADIKSCGIKHLEYIFRPIYKEKIQKGILKSIKKYEAYGRETFARIISDFNEKEPTSQIAKIMSVKVSAGMKVAETVMDKVGSTSFLNNNKKYNCVNEAGRESIVSLKRVLPIVIKEDGTRREVEMDQLGAKDLKEYVGASIEVIPTLVIKTKSGNTYWIKGNGIDVENVQDEYYKIDEHIELNEMIEDNKEDGNDGRKIDEYQDKKELISEVVDVANTVIGKFRKKH